MTARFEAGDGLRAFAALSVVVYHFAYEATRTTGNGWFTDAFGAAGGRALGALELGLYVFFVLSGYLIAGPFVRALAAGEPLPRAGRYARNRVLRIVPAFWVVFTALLIAHGTVGSSAGEVAAVYLFAQNYDTSMVSLLVGPAWTLGIEVAFYALVPVAAWLLARAGRSLRGERARRRLLLAGAGAVWVASLAVRELVPETIGWQRSVPAMLFAFMPGAALACVQPSLAARCAALRRPGVAAGALVAGSVCLFAAYTATAPLGAFPPLPGAVPGVLASAGSALLVAASMVLQWAGRPPPRVLGGAAARWIGERSYGLYLVHQGLLITVAGLFDYSARPGLRLAGYVAVGVPICLLAAAVLFAVVERPLLVRRRGWRQRAAPPVAAPTPSLPSG